MKRLVKTVPLPLEIPSPTLPDTVDVVELDLSLQFIVTFCPSVSKPFSFNFDVNLFQHSSPLTVVLKSFPGTFSFFKSISLSLEKLLGVLEKSSLLLPYAVTLFDCPSLRI